MEPHKQRLYSYTPSNLPPIEIGSITKRALDVYADPKPDKLEALLELVRSFKRDLEEMAAEAGGLEDGADIPSFLRKAIGWEIGWNYAPEYLVEAMEKATVGEGVNVNNLRELLSQTPPIPDKKQEEYSFLYGYREGKEKIEVKGDGASIPFDLLNPKTEKVNSFFSQGYILGGTVQGLA